MTTINPYLLFNGNAEKAFIFYKSAFGGEFTNLSRFKDMPDASKVSAGERNRLMHVSLPLGNGSVLMGSDSAESLGGHKITIGNNFSVSVNAESEDEATRLFNGLSVNGVVTMPLARTFWGSYFGMFIDQFGIQWMISYEYKQS
jgi:PhnB protein